MPEFYDYYSLPYESIDAINEQIEQLQGEGVEISGPFRIGDVYAPGGPQGKTFVSPGLWHFNARHTSELTGDWIGPEPTSPARVWAE